MARNFLNGVNLNLTELLQAVAQKLGTDPSTTEGRFYYHSGRQTWVFHNASGIINLGRLDQISAPTAAVGLNSQKITSLADPTAAQDAATKAYVDGLLQGLAWKDEVRAASTANVTLASAVANGGTLDGVTLATGDRILLKNQSAGAENGIYVVAASGAPTRATDADTGTEMVGATVFVSEGTANADTAWTFTTNGPITLGTTALTVVKMFGGATSSVNKYSQTYGGSASQAITHNLGTTLVQVQVRDATSLAVVEPDIVITDANTVTLTEATAPAASSRIVVVLG